MISFHCSLFSADWSTAVYFLHGFIDGFLCLIFLLFNLISHCCVRRPRPGDFHVCDASVNIVSWRACLPDNTVFIITDWLYISSNNPQSHVRAHCVIPMFICSQAHDRARHGRARRGRSRKTGQCCDWASAVVLRCHLDLEFRIYGVNKAEINFHIAQEHMAILL